jgi:hypothetical protein
LTSPLMCWRKPRGQEWSGSGGECRFLKCAGAEDGTGSPLLADCTLYLEKLWVEVERNRVLALDYRLLCTLEIAWLLRYYPNSS